MIFNLYMSGQDPLEINDFTTVKEEEKPNSAENITLNGSMYVDYIYRRRTWTLNWNIISKTTFNNIKTRYDLQYTDGLLATVHIPERDINVLCHLQINTLNLKYDDQWIEGFELTIEEMGAIS